MVILKDVPADCTNKTHAEWFQPPAQSESRDPIVDKAIEIADAADIGRHPFFKLAARSREALMVWVSQELAVTGPFSQLLLQTAAEIRNVHARSMVVQVAYGEHNAMRGRVATHSHPWLLEEFRVSVGVDPTQMPVLPETTTFLNELRRDCSGSILRALGALGVGNERLLITEYAAVRRAFVTAWPQAKYQRFLDANIEEDTAHSIYMAEAADALVGWGHDPQDFFDGGQASVESRRRYYDALTRRLESAG